jgi:elongation factor Ts
VLVEVNCETDFVAKTEEFKQFVHDICLQIAASAPGYISREEVPKTDIAKEEKLEKKALEAEGKPAKIINGIVKGKMEKYYGTVCLLDQPYVRDPEKQVKDLLQSLIAKLGENVVVSRFARLELGVSD